MIYCTIETNIVTSQVAYPFQSGWLETPDWLVLREKVTDEFLTDGDACALIDAIDATRFFGTHSVVADLALVSSHRGPIALRTAARPDEVEHATVQLGEVSSTAEALARATIHHFYGIDVVDWYRSSLDAEVTVIEGQEVLQKPESGFVEDLVKAWFVLTSLAMPTHVFIAPTAALESNQSTIRSMVEKLRSAISLTEERRREFRRNIAGDLEVDRELLTEFYGDQSTRLTRGGRKGWLDLTNRMSRAMNLPSGANPDVVSFGLAREE